MPPEAEAPVSGALSIEQAASLIETHDDPQDQAPGAAAGDQAGGQAAAAAGDQAAQGDAGAQASEDTNSEGAASTPDDAAQGAENPAEAGEETDAEAGAVAPAEPPTYWSQDAKAKFAELPPELQAVVLAQEGPREAAAAKAKDDAAKIRAAAEQELAGITRFAEEVATFLPQAVQTFRSRWGDNPDWVAYGQLHGAEAMSLAKAQYDAERAQLQQVAQASKVAEGKAREVYVRGEFEALEKLAPDLTDPKEGPARRTEITKYLADTGYPPEAIRDISAKDMVIARKAMLWDRAQAKSAPTSPPKPAPAASRPLARGGAAAGPADPAAKAAQTAKNRFSQTRSIADAAALLEALD